jgi:peptidoglycan/LPS O-acetylase OafA/YrhL
VLPAWAGLAVTLLLLWYLQVTRSGTFNVLIYFISAALIIAIVLGKEGWFRYLLRRRFFTFLGMISYSLYMSHHAVLWVCNMFVRVVLKKPEAMIAGISYPQLTFVEACVANVVALAMVIIVSAFVYRWVEDPMRRQSREFTGRLLPQVKVATT